MRRIGIFTVPLSALVATLGDSLSKERRGFLDLSQTPKQRFECKIGVTVGSEYPSDAPAAFEITVDEFERAVWDYLPSGTIVEVFQTPEDRLDQTASVVCVGPGCPEYEPGGLFVINAPFEKRRPL